MNDEGVGIAGWLLADLALVLAIVFLAFTPAALSDDPEVPEPTPTAEPEPIVAPPVILDIGCEATGAPDGSISVRCEPEVDGGDALFEWHPVRGRARSSRQSPTFSASFAEAGAVRLTVTNASGTRSAEFAVLPPSPPSQSAASANLVLDSFRFDQIVFCGAIRHQVDWKQISTGRVRENVSKDEELSGEWCGSGDGGALTFLRRKQKEGYRIAMVETFSNLNRTLNTELSDEVNGEFYTGLAMALDADVGDIFVECNPRERWFARYASTNSLDPGEVRINIFFVRRNADEDCE